MKVDYFRVTPDTVESVPGGGRRAAGDDGDARPGAARRRRPSTSTSRRPTARTRTRPASPATEYRVDGGEWQVAENGGGSDPFTSSVTVSRPASTPSRYRSRDDEGNLEVADEIEFTIEGGGDEDTTAPVTAHALDPSSPGAGGTYSGPVGVTLSATDPAGGSEPGEPETHDVDATGTVWTPSDVDAVTGDVVRWNFEEPDAVFPHDVWVVPPGGNPDPAGSDMYQVTPGIVMPGGASVTETVDEAGSWTFVCKLHAGFSGGAWTGMTGTIDVTEGGSTGPEPSGVDFTEYRVNSDGEDGAWVRSDNDAGADPFDTEFTVSAAGSHVVEYRSTDGAGNAETAKSVAFSIGDGPGEGAPTVEGFADPTTGPAPLRVRFTATGLDPDGGRLSYRWQFAGEDAVLSPNANYTFTEPGTHTATVTVTDEEGLTATDTVEITVLDPNEDNEPPTVTASVDEDSGPAPHRARFDATGVDPDGRNADLVYHWSFGDGGESLARRPAHTYREPGEYTATVTVTDPYGATATADVDVEVTDGAANQPPTVEAAVAPSLGSAPLSVQLSAQATDPDGDRVTYRWAFGDGQEADGRSVRHVYFLPGTYSATVTATDVEGATATDSVQIVAGNPPANQAPTVRVAADPASGAAPLSVRFTSASSDPEGASLMHVWEFGDGSARRRPDGGPPLQRGRHVHREADGDRPARRDRLRDRDGGRRRRTQRRAGQLDVALGARPRERAELDRPPRPARPEGDRALRQQRPREGDARRQQAGGEAAQARAPHHGLAQHPLPRRPQDDVPDEDPRQCRRAADGEPAAAEDDAAGEGRARARRGPHAHSPRGRDPLAGKSRALQGQRPGRRRGGGELETNDREGTTMRKRMLTTAGAVTAALIASLAAGSGPAAANGEQARDGDQPRVMVYTGTTGYRHADAINSGRPIVQAALEQAGYRVDWEDCTDNGGNAGNCDHATENPRVFRLGNLLRYDALLFFNASASWAGGGKPGPLWDERQRAAIIQYVQLGGGIAANHNATDMGAGVVSWDWWDGGQNSVVGTLMRGHARTDRNNIADVHVEDPSHLSTITLPPLYGVRRRALQLRAQRARHPPRAAHARRVVVRPGPERDGRGPPDHLVQALPRPAGRGRHGPHAAVLGRAHVGHRHGPLRRFVHRERRRQRARAAARRRRPLGRRRRRPLRLRDLTAGGARAPHWRPGPAPATTRSSDAAPPRTSRCSHRAAGRRLFVRLLPHLAI